VRKGATPAFPGQRGAIGGSMGDVSVIVRGVDSPASQQALYSTVHGAGRVMSRTAAAGKVKWTRDPKSGKKGPVRVSEGAVSQEMMDEWLQREGVVLRGGGRDESPHVYRRLPEVLDAHAGTIEVEHVLRPLVVVMAGADVSDPYKD
jgi:tRNA-splicing ligase RtcB (3'-phosphate/5'-hydroxy nucleic acid ligase)